MTNTQIGFLLMITAVTVMGVMIGFQSSYKSSYKKENTGIVDGIVFSESGYTLLFIYYIGVVTLEPAAMNVSVFAESSPALYASMAAIGGVVAIVLMSLLCFFVFRQLNKLVKRWNRTITINK